MKTKINKLRRKATPALLLNLALLMCLGLGGCGKKAPVQPIELPVDNGAAAISLATGDLSEASSGASDVTVGEAAAEVTTDVTATEIVSQATTVTTAQEVAPEAPAAEATTSAAVEAAPEVAPEPKTAESDTTTAQNQSEAPPVQAETMPTVYEDGEYDSVDFVAMYIHTFGKLPSNYITKKEAKKLGWSGGSLEEYAPGKCIGGDYFGNYEGLLPEDKEYHECDIGTMGKKKRGAKRIIYSTDGYIYYTDDHYESFVLLYEP